MDLDPNYDPSDFLPTGNRNFRINEDKSLAGPSNPNSSSAIQDDLAISDSDEDKNEISNITDDANKTDGDLGELWF